MPSQRTFLAPLRLKCLAASSLTFLCAAIPIFAEAQVNLPLKWAFSQVFMPQCVALSNDGKWVATGGMGGALLYNRSTGTAKNLEPIHAIVNHVCFSPNSRTLAITSENSSDVGVTQLWNVQTGTLVSTIPYPATSNGVIAFAPTGSTLAIAGEAKTGGNCIQLWDSISVKPTQTIPLDIGPVSVAFSKDGKRLACGGFPTSGSCVEVFDLPSGKLLRKIGTSTFFDILSVSLSPDGSIVTSSGGNWDPGFVNLWSVSTGKLLHSLNMADASAVNQATFSPDGKTLATAKEGSSIKDTVQIWDVASGQLLQSLPTLAAGGAWGVAYSADGKTLVSAGIGGYQAPVAADASLLEFWTASGASTGYFYTAAKTVQGPISFTNNGKALVVPEWIQGDTTGAHVVEMYDAQTGKLIGPAHAPTNGQVTARAFSPSRNELAIASSTTGSNPAFRLDICDPLTEDLLKTIDVEALGPIHSLVFSRDGNQIYITAGVSQKRPYVIDLVKGSHPTPISSSADVVKIFPLADGNTVGLLHPKGNSVELTTWDWAANRQVTSLTSGSRQVLGTDISPDGRTLAIQGCTLYSEGFGQTWEMFAYGFIELWDIATSTLTASLGGDPVGVPRPGETFAIAFSPDGQYLFGSYGGPVAVSMADHSIQTLNNGSPFSMAFSPDGSLVACGPWGEEGIYVGKNPFFGLVVPKAVTINPSLASGGRSIEGTVHLQSPAPPKGAYLTLSSSDPHASFQTTLIVPPGAVTATFKIQTRKVPSKTAVKITASAGNLTASATLIIS